MKELVRQLYLFFARMGGFGLLGLGILDSSILFMPLGNDLLMVALSVRKPALVPFYALMATLGSVIGCAITDAVSRKGGEEGLDKRFPRKRVEFVKRKIKKRAGWALAFAAMMPPPFPFTVFLASVAALQYPRKKLLAIIAAARFARFSLLGVAAIFLGRKILRWAESPAVYYAVIGLLAISIVGSALSIYTWIKSSRKK